MNRLGVQLLVYGSRQREDLPGVLAEIKAAGYDGAEAGGDGRPLLPGEVIISSFANAGLALSGLHIGYAHCVDESRLNDHIAFLKQAGSRFLICSGVADNNSITGYEAAAETFNEVGQKCLDAGLTFCYHNHAWEFRRLEGGRQGLYTLLERTSPRLVKLCIDVFWAHIGGESPGRFIAQHADRAGYYHFKDGAGDFDSQTFIELGQGDVDLVGARDEALEHPLEWIVYEQDRVELEPRVAIRRSRNYLKQIGL